MNFQDALKAMRKGLKVRLPEWRGYWFMDGKEKVFALTKEGDVKDAWVSHYINRDDFEIANGLDFGWAITAIKAGKLVTRKGWNGKRMYVFLQPADSIEVETLIKHVKSLPSAVKEDFDKTYDGDYIGVSSGEPFKVGFTPYFCMKNAQGDIMNGWIPTQTDCLCEDWDLYKQ